jgi:hypothetical protein
MTTADIAMMVGGIVLLAVTIGLVIYCVVKDKSYKPLLVLFGVAIVMIGFPQIKSANFLGVNIVESQTVTAIQAFQKNPTDPSYIANARQALIKYDTAQQGPVPLQLRTNLTATVRVLSKEKNLPPASEVVYSHALLLLGETNAAQSQLRLAIKSDPSLESTLDPKMASLLHPSPR